MPKNLKPEHNLTVTVAIAKKDILPCVACYGRCNAEPLVIRSKTYAPGQLRYVTFAGSLQDDGLYHGEHRFYAAKDGTDAQVPIGQRDGFAVYSPFVGLHALPGIVPSATSPSSAVPDGSSTPPATIEG